MMMNFRLTLYDGHSSVNYVFYDDFERVYLHALTTNAPYWHITRNKDNVRIMERAGKHLKEELAFIRKAREYALKSFK
jgi:hypothetical protein